MSHPAVPGLILGIPDFLKFDVAEIYRQGHRCLDRVDSGKSLIVVGTHLVLVIGTLVQQKGYHLAGRNDAAAFDHNKYLGRYYLGGWPTAR